MIVARSAGWSSARPRVGDSQLDRGDRALDRVDVLPVDVPLADRQPQCGRDAAVGALEPEPAEQSRCADVDRDQAVRALDLVEPQVVDADDLAPVDVDDLLVHEVLAQEDLVGALAELADVDRGGAQPRAAVVEVGHGRPGQEDPAPVGRDDEARDRRVARTERDDQIGDLADGLVAAIPDGTSDDLAEIEHLPPRDGSRRAGGRPGDGVATAWRGPGGWCHRPSRRAGRRVGRNGSWRAMWWRARHPVWVRRSRGDVSSSGLGATASRAGRRRARSVAVGRGRGGAGRSDSIPSTTGLAVRCRARGTIRGT